MIEKYSKNQDMIRKAAKMAARKKHPEATVEEIWEISKTEEMQDEAVKFLKTMEIRDRLDEEYAGTKSVLACERQAESWITKAPKELMLNVDEWIEGKPLSDIKIHGVSVNDIWKMYGNEHITFMQIMRFFISWKESGFEGKDAHYYFFAIL